jgi:hypothetical protein
MADPDGRTKIALALTIGATPPRSKFLILQNFKFFSPRRLTNEGIANGGVANGPSRRKLLIHCACTHISPDLSSLVLLSRIRGIPGAQ